MERTVRVRYEGGSESFLDIPDAGTMARSQFDDAVAKGRIVILDDDETTEPAVVVDPDAVPDGAITAVVDWVRGAPEDTTPADGWVERAQRALDVEVAGKNRTSLVKLLTTLVEIDDRVHAEPTE